MKIKRITFYGEEDREKILARRQREIDEMLPEERKKWEDMMWEIAQSFWKAGVEHRLKQKKK